MAVRRCVQNRCSAAHLSPQPISSGTAACPAEPRDEAPREADRLGWQRTHRVHRGGHGQQPRRCRRGALGRRRRPGLVAAAPAAAGAACWRAGLGEASVLELGAGTGLVGLSAAILCGAAVLMTDRGDGLQVSERCPACAWRSLQGEVAGRRSPSGTLGATPPRRYRTCFTPPT